MVAAAGSAILDRCCPVKHAVGMHTNLPGIGEVASLCSVEASHVALSTSCVGLGQLQDQLTLVGCCVCCPCPRSTWLDTWRKHLTAALSRKLVVPAQLPPAPEPLPHAIRALMCSCHPHEQPLLAVPLPEVVNKRGRWVAVHTVACAPGAALLQTQYSLS